MARSAIVSGTAAPTGRRWAYAGCLLLATMLGCAAELGDEGALDQGETQEVGVVRQAMGATATVRSGLGDRTNVWNGNYGVWIKSGPDCKVTPFTVQRVKLSDGALQSTNLGCRRRAERHDARVDRWFLGRAELPSDLDRERRRIHEANRHRRLRARHGSHRHAHLLGG